MVTNTTHAGAEEDELLWWENYICLPSFKGDLRR